MEKSCGRSLAIEYRVLNDTIRLHSHSPVSDLKQEGPILYDAAHVAFDSVNFGDNTRCFTTKNELLYFFFFYCRHHWRQLQSFPFHSKILIRLLLVYAILKRRILKAASLL